MNREIKFRALDGQEMIELNSVWNDTCHYDCGEDHECERDPLLWDIMQYTGLKDKKGKEIYEGDLLCYRDNGEMINVTEVKLEELDFNGISYLGWNIPTNTECEVIGNIHEDPKLLTV